jgi:hypothetical protein
MTTRSGDARDTQRRGVGGQDNPNLVMVEETFDTRDQALAVWTSAEPKAAMAADGIDMSSLWVEYFDEVDSGKPADG